MSALFGNIITILLMTFLHLVAELGTRNHCICSSQSTISDWNLKEPASFIFKYHRTAVIFNSVQNQGWKGAKLAHV